MPILDVQKLTSEPSTYKPNTLYLINTTASSDELQIAVSSNDGSVIKHVITEAKVKSLINAIAPIGSLIKSLSPNTPSGYLKCNGAVVSKITYSDLYSVIGDQYTPSFIETVSVPWLSQCGFNKSTQNDITEWASTNSLVTAVKDAASLVTKNYIYILGGNSSNGALNTIQRASFDANGDLSSTWSNVGTIPTPMYGMGYVATKGRFYLLGGWSSSGGFSTVYSAPINADGTLGDFRTETPLPGARANIVCFVIKDKLYVVGGYTNTVYRTTVNSDGTLSSWETLPNFPISFDYGRHLIIKDRVYIFEAYNFNNSVSSIYYATYDSDGNIGTWTYVSDMPNNIIGSAMVCTDNYVFSMGGLNLNNFQYTNISYRAPILADGNIGTWIQITNGPVAASYAQSAIAGNRIYFIGGFNGSDSLNSVYSANFASGVTDYTPYYTDQPNTSTTFNLPNYYSNALPSENYYIKY